MNNFTLITEGSKSSPFVPKYFSEQILLHVARNLLDIPNYLAPLYLGIQGEKGIGKSFQAIEACVAAQIAVVLTSATDLSGQYEGESREKLISLYKYAVETSNTLNRPVVILIDDFHLGVASIHQGITQTINSQLLTGLMMNLHDNHEILGQGIKRIPIILIANDFTAVYSPLTRNGRMKLFTYSPSVDDKIHIVNRLFSGVKKDKYKFIDKFVRRYPDKPVSFFLEVRSSCFELLILEALDKFRAFDTYLLSDYVVKNQYRIHEELIWNFADRISSQQLIVFEKFK